jgi:MFS family permease
MSVFGASNAASSLVAGRASDRFGRIAPLAAGVAVYCGTLATLACLPGPLGETGVYAAAIGVGVGNGAIFTLTYSLLSERFAGDSTATA